jgi:hypothetical protein
MNGQKSQQHAQQTPYPTSPWTEVYQSAPCSGSKPKQAGKPMAGYHYDCNDDMQQPTHDALSESYN